MGLDREGRPVQPSLVALTGQAKVALQAVLGELLIDQSISRALFSEQEDISPTADEHTLPSHMQRVLNITRGSDNAPLRPFNSQVEHDLWYYSRYGNLTVSADAPLAYYYSGRDARGRAQITFSPGIGSQTSLTVRFIRKATPPYRVGSLFPVEIHGVVLAGVLNFMTGNRYRDEYEQLKGDAARALDVVVGGIQKMRHSPNVRRKIRRANAMVSGPQSSWPSSVKWAD